MTAFIEGTFRPITGYIKQRLSKRNIQGLAASGEIDDELWILLEYYSEVENVGTDYLKRAGISNISTRRKIFKHFQAHIRQAKSFYYAAKKLPPRSSGLLYYYCFLNLAKAILVVKNPSIAGKKDLHGMEYKISNNSIFEKQTVAIKQDGVFPNLYNWYFGQKITVRQLNISSLLSYCTDIGYQCQIAGVKNAKMLYCYYAHCVDKNQKTGWALLGIPQVKEILKYKKTFEQFLLNYEKVDLPQMQCREIFNIDAFKQSSFTFFQSKQPQKWISDNIPPAHGIRSDLLNVFAKTIQMNYFPNDYDFIFSLPYNQNNQTMMDETMAIYITMFYLSNLVRYKPQYLERLLNKKEAWLVDSFVRLCPVTFLRSMISRIIGSDYIMERR